MRRLSLPQRFRSALGLALLAACVNDSEASCTLDGPLGPGWNTTPPTIPDFVVIGAWQSAVGVGDTIRWALFAPAATSVWSTDSSVAAVLVHTGEILVIGRGIGTATVRAQHGLLGSAEPVEVVAQLCTASNAIPSLTFDQEDVVSLNDEDCALPRRIAAPVWPWKDPFAAQETSLRAEGRRITLADSAFVRVEAAAVGLRPYLQITTDSFPVAAKFHFLDSLFLAAELGPGEYVLWTATEEARPTTDLRIALREVTLCPTIVEAPTPIAPGDTVEGALGRTSCHTHSGHTAADFRLTIPATGRYYVAVQVLEPAAYGEVFFLVRGEFGDGYLASGNSIEWEAGAHEVRLMSTSDISYRVSVLACPSVGLCP